MSGAIPEIVAVLRANTDDFTAHVSRAGAELKGFGTSADTAGSRIGGALAGAAKAGGLAAAAIGVVSLKMAGDFERSMTELVTGAGEAQKNIGLVSAGILAMAGKVGQTPAELAKGLYMIESAGYHGAAGLKVLQAAAEGAKVGNADMMVTADATTTVLRDYHMSANQAADAVNFLTITTAQGKTHMQDLAGALATILPTASALHIPLEQIGGALSTMTARGVPAADAATYLRFTIAALANPTSKASGEMHKLGLSAEQVQTSLATKGLLPTLQMLTEAVGKHFPAGSAQALAAMANMTGGTRGLQAALSLTGQNMGDFVANTANVAAKMKEGHGQVVGWAAAQQDFNVKMSQFKGAASAAAIELGQHLLPYATKLIGWATDAAMWLGQHVGPALQAVAGFAKDVAAAFSTLVSFVERNKTAFEGLGLAVAALAAPRIVGAISTLVEKIGLTLVANANAAKLSLQGLARDGLGALTNPITWAAAGVAGLVVAWQMHNAEIKRAKAAVDSWVASVTKIVDVNASASVVDLTHAFNDNVTATQGVVTGLQAVNAAHGGGIAGWDGYKAAVGEANKKLGEASDAGQAWMTKLSQIGTFLGLNAEQVQYLANRYHVDLTKGADEAAQAILRAGRSETAGAGASGVLAAALTSVGDTAGAASIKADALRTSLDQLSGKAIDAVTAQNNVVIAIDGVISAVQRNAQEYHSAAAVQAADTNTVVGILQQMMTATINASAAGGAAAQKAATQYTANYNTLAHSLSAVGINLDTIASTVHAMPSQITKTISINVDTSQLQAAQQQIAALQQQRWINTGTIGVGRSSGKATGGLIYGMAMGGRRPGSADWIHTLLASGEYVINARAAAQIGTPALNAVNSSGMLPAAPVPVGGGTTVVNVTVTLDGKPLAAQVRTQMLRDKRGTVTAGLG